MSEPKKIIIVGGGLSGLSAAYTLKKAGYTADIYEAGSTTGGRCANDYTDGYEFFVGAGSTEPQWKTTFQYLEELGLMDKVIKQAGESGIGLCMNDKAEIAMLGGGLGKTLKNAYHFGYKVLPKAARKQGFKFLKLLGNYKKQLDFENADFTALEPISRLSVAEWAKQNDMGDLDNYILSPLLSMMCCASSDDIAMGHLVLLFSLMQGMCSMEGGMGIISEALTAQVADQIHFKSPVEEVVIENGKATGVRVNGEFIPADHVLVGLDAQRTLEVVPGLSEAQKAALSTCGYSRTLYYEFGLKEPIERIKHSFLMMPKDRDTILNCISDAGDADHPILLAHTRGEYQDELLALDAAERDARVIAEIQKVFPEFPDKPVITKMYVWERAVNLEGPGQFEAVNKLKRDHMHDIEGLHLSGDYLFLIASTEGAMNSGQLAAEYLIGLLK